MFARVGRCYTAAMPRRPDPLAQSIAPESLLSTLAEPQRAGLYLSHGFGPAPGRPLEHVRVAVMPGAPFAAVQAAGEAWVAAARPVVPWPLTAIDPDELVAPSAGSPWSAIAEPVRAALLLRGAELLADLAPEIGAFHMNDALGGVLLARVRASLAAGLPPMDTVVLDHLMYAAITARLLRRTDEAVVIADAGDSTWSIRQAFPEHATVWRRALVCAPLQEVRGLGFALLAELVVRELLAGRSGGEGPATSPGIAAALAAAEAVIGPRIVNLLGDGDRVPVRN